MPWVECSEERYDEMLCVLPPELMTYYGFLVGEPSDHDSEGNPRFAAFARKDGKFREYFEPITVETFKALGKLIALESNP